MEQSKDKHGSCVAPVQDNLKFNADFETADRICCFNRHYAEYAGYSFTEEHNSWIDEVRTNFEKNGKPTTFYDSVTGKPLYKAPVGRSVAEFISESRAHGWPSFRDKEVVWDYVRVLKDGEAVSVDGTHLGHNLPDSKGNRHCINLVSIAGNPK